MKNILIIDDEESIRNMLAYAISQFGHNPYTAGNCAEAIEVLLKKPEIDIAILDLKMPGISGKEAGLLLKNLKPDIELIIASASVNEIAGKELDQLGVKHILNKPYHMTELQTIIG